MNRQQIQKITDEYISSMTPDELARFASILVARTRKSRLAGDITEEQADRTISDFVNKHVNHIPSIEHRIKYIKSLGTCSVHEMQHELMSIYFHDMKSLMNCLQTAITINETLLVETTVLRVYHPDPEMDNQRPHQWMERTATATGVLIDRLNSVKKNLVDLQSSDEWKITDILPPEAKTVSTPEPVLRRMNDPDYKDPDLQPFVSVLEHLLPGEPTGDYLSLWQNLQTQVQEQDEPAPGQ